MWEMQQKEPHMIVDHQKVVLVKHANVIVLVQHPLIVVEMFAIVRQMLKVTDVIDAERAHLDYQHQILKVVQNASAQVLQMNVELAIYLENKFQVLLLETITASF